MTLLQTTAAIRRRFNKFKAFTLEEGAHVSLNAGACAMELAAHVAGEEWSDSPQCVDAALAAACRKANDRGPQWVRDALRDRIPQLIGTAGGHKLSIKRAEVLAWFAIREAAPIALRARGFTEHADKLAGFTGTLRAAGNAAYAAGNAAYAASTAAYAASTAAYAASTAASNAAYAANAAASTAASTAADAADAAAKPWNLFIAALDRAIEVRS